MSRTKTAAELYGLLVEETYGEVPYRIFTLLLLRGRQSVYTLAQHTRLPPRHVRHGLVVLIQQNLTYFHTEDESGITFYEADQEASYFLLRSGKILEHVSSRYGSLAQDIVQNLLFLGHARIGDLIAACQEKQQSLEAHVNGMSKVEPLLNGNQNGSDKHINGNSSKGLEDAMSRLLDLGLVVPVIKLKLQSPSDLYEQVEKEILGSHFRNDTKGPKQKEELKAKVVERLHEIRAESEIWQHAGAKRGFEGEHANGNEKRRKLTNGVDGVDRGSPALQSQNTWLDLDLTVKINYEKCKIVLRHQQLISLARGDLGETTSRVYGALLKLLEARVPRCQLDPTIDDPEDINEAPSISTMELVQAMDKSILPSFGIGKLDRDSLLITAVKEPERKGKGYIEDSEAITTTGRSNLLDKPERKRKRNAQDADLVTELEKRAAPEKVPKKRKRNTEDAEPTNDPLKAATSAKAQRKRRRDEEDSEATIESAASSGDDGEEGSSDVDEHGNIPEVEQDSDSLGESTFGEPTYKALAVKPLRSTRVTFDEKILKPVDRENQMRRAKDVKNHLLLLADYSPPFVRRCGTRGLGEWTVDFDKLVQYMQETEMNDFISEAHGKLGWRMVRILKQKGKLDEKQIQKYGLLKLSDVRTTLVEMQMSGIIDIQEIPKDIAHLAARTIFLWYFDTDRAKLIILERIYKTMSRCLQVLKAEKFKQREVLSQVERTDVKGKESEMLPPVQLARLNEIRETERRIFTQIGRLDTMVAIFKDF